MRKRCASVPLVVVFSGLVGGCGERPAGGGVLLTPAPTGAPKTANALVDALVRDNLAAELSEQPTQATWLGVHAADDRFEDVRPEAVKRQLGRLQALRDRLAALDERELDAEHAYDRRLLDARSAQALYTLTELRPYERNPLLYTGLVQSGLYELIADDYLPATDRWRAIVGRLRKLAALLGDARHNLRPTASELSVRRAAEQAQATRGFIAEILPRTMELPDAKLVDDLRLAVADAGRALDEFSGWLAHELQPRARGDVALGRERLMEWLRRGEGVDVTPELLVALGERELKQARIRVEQVALEHGAGHAALDVNRLMEEDHPAPGEFLPTAQALLDSALGLVRRTALVPLAGTAPPRVVEMPAILWGFLQLEVAGPLEPRPREALLYVDGMERVARPELLRACNRPMMARTLLHEALGHYLQGERNRRAPTTMQKIALSPLFIEGWAGYVEPLLLAQGWRPEDRGLRVAVARAMLVRAVRLVAAVRLHALGAKLDDVVKLFGDEAGLEEPLARREAERVATDPMVLLDGLGRIAIVKLRDDWLAVNRGATLGAFHEALLAHGSGSPLLLRRRLLPPGSGSAL